MEQARPPDSAYRKIWSTRESFFGGTSQKCQGKTRDISVFAVKCHLMQNSEQILNSFKIRTAEGFGRHTQTNLNMTKDFVKGDRTAV